MPITLDPALPAPGTPEGYYGDLDDCYAVAGSDNLLTYSDLNSTGALDTARVQVAMTYADDEINDALKRQGVSYPAATDATSFSLLSQAFGYMVTAWLYRSRGQRDTLPDGSIDYAKENGWKKEARQLVGRFISSQRQTLTGQYSIDTTR